jgi:hypothetical protein
MVLGENCKKDEPCTNCPPPPPTNCEYPPGNRNFIWRLDTVAWFPSTLGGVWAFSDSDAYVMGNIFQISNGVSKGYIGLHWNGKKWDININGTVDEIKHVANDVTGDDYFMVSVGNWSITPPKPGLGEFNNLTKKWKGYQFETQGELRSVWTDGNGYFIAVGDNGMVYTKDGYTAEWMYQKASTDFNFIKIAGISKEEIYGNAVISLATGEIYQQYWKYDGKLWYKLYDGQDTTGTPVKLYNTDNGMYDIAATRCSITDSIKLYLIGWESFLLEAKGQSLDYNITNLTELGLPLRNLGRTAFRISLFSPNDIWIFGTRYNFYHWNGSNFQKIVIPGLPNDDMQFGDQRRMIKTFKGKAFLATEISSQVYAVVQGTP